MLNTVIFDMDGLLIDSEPLWALSMQEVFATVGVEITPGMALQTTGLRTKEVVSFWHDQFRWESAKSKEQIAGEIIDNVIYRIVSGGTSMEGIHYILDYFREKNFKIGLASSSPMRLITSALDHLQIRSHFQAIYSAEFEPHGKPHPAVYLACAQDLNSHPLQCLAFEDSVNGMIAAKAARMKAVVVPEPHHQQDRRFALADLKLNSLLDFSDEHFLQLNTR